MQSAVAADAPSPALLLAQLLSRTVGKPVHLVLTNNRSTMMSSRTEHGVMKVRLHRMFLDAQPHEQQALAEYLAGRKTRAGKVIDAFIASRAPRIAHPPSPTQPVGRFHNLLDIWGEQNASFFHDASQARITWGSSNTRRYRRTIQLGCYVAEEGLIRIHPALDQAFVPRHYIAWIVFHEMLHEVFGVEQRGGRRCVHPPEFMALEESHPDFAKCKKWEAENIHRLLRFRG